MTRAATKRSSIDQFAKDSTSIHSNAIESELDQNVIESELDENAIDAAEDEILIELEETRTIELIDKTYRKNDIVEIIIKAKENDDRKMPRKTLRKSVKLALKDIAIRSDRVYYKSPLFILEFDELKLHLLKKHHDLSMQNHSEYKTMYVKLLKNYY